MRDALLEIDMKQSVQRLDSMERVTYMVGLRHCRVGGEGHQTHSLPVGRRSVSSDGVSIVVYIISQQ